MAGAQMTIPIRIVRGTELVGKPLNLWKSEIEDYLGGLSGIVSESCARELFTPDRFKSGLA